MAIKIHEIEKVTVSKRPRRNKAKILAWKRKEKKTPTNELVIA